MKNNNFWNDAAKYGAIIGAILSVSFLFEQWMALSGKTSNFAIIGLEWLLVVILHYYLLHRFTRQRSMLYSAEEGFTFGQGYGYLMVISAFAGIISGVVQFVTLHLVVGYTNYVDKYIAAIQNLLSQSGGIPASMEGIFSQAIQELQTAPTPSIFSTIWSGLFVSLLFGAVYGLIIGGVIARPPKPFEQQNNEQ